MLALIVSRFSSTSPYLCMCQTRKIFKWFDMCGSWQIETKIDSKVVERCQPLLQSIEKSLYKLFCCYFVIVKIIYSSDSFLLTKLKLMYGCIEHFVCQMWYGNIHFLIAFCVNPESPTWILSVRLLIHKSIFTSTLY